MAQRDKYIIKVEGKLIEVSPDVYYAYFRMERQERWQEEKKQQHDVMSYDALDDGETVGSEAIPDLQNPSLEEQTIAQDLKVRLNLALASLSEEDQKLIQAIYYEGVSERDYAQMEGISQMGANKRKRKILSKLKKFLDI